MRRSLLLACAATALVLAACTVGPNYRRPDLPAAPQWSERAGGQAGVTLSTVTSDTASLQHWWTQFKDPVLDDLVRRALADNLTLAQARARVLQAREQVIIARAAGLPTLSGSTNAIRVDTQSQNLGTILGGGSGAASTTATNGAAAAAAGSSSSSSGGGPNRIAAFTLGFNAAWQLDLFGAVRRQVEGARAQAEQQEWSARDSQVSVASEVANAYLQLRLAQSRAQVLRQDLLRQEGLFKIIGDRFRTGFVTNLDVDQQRVQLANTQAQIPQQDAQADAQAHAIATLLGLTPGALYPELSAPRPLPAVPPTLPAGLPSDLLRRRPDIRASERQLAAASAQIGSAVAAEFPTLNLTLLPSWTRIDIGDMFQKPTRTLLSLAQGSAPLYQGGQLRAAVRQAQAAYDQAYAGYKQTALQAFQEVEDAIVRYQSDQRRWTALTDAHQAALRADTIARQQYAVGLTDYTGVYNAEGSLYTIQDQLTQADAALATDVVSLYTALGGGWDDTAVPAPGAKPVGPPKASRAPDVGAGPQASAGRYTVGRRSTASTATTASARTRP